MEIDWPLTVMLTSARWFRAATRRYRGVSPFPLAMLDFQRGKLWMEHDDLRRARALVRRATSSPPAHPRQRHADGGDRGATIWRQPVTTTTYVADRTALLIPAIRATSGAEEKKPRLPA